MRLARCTALLACAGSLIALTTSCGGSTSSHDKGGDAKPSEPRGVISKTRADAVLDRYERVNNRANAKRDGKLLATVEGGTLLAQSRADYYLEKRDPEEKKEEYTPFTYTQRKFHIPRKGTADWFAVSARSKTSRGTPKDPSLLIFRRADGDWKNVAHTTHLRHGKPLEFAQDKDGFVRTVSDTSTKSGTMAPDDLRSALVELFTIRGSLSTAPVQATTTARNLNQKASKADREIGQGGAITFSEGGIDDSTVYALKTRDGKTFAVFSAGVDRTARATEFGYQITPNEIEAHYVGKSPAEEFVASLLCQASALLPEKGKPELLGEYDIMTGSVRD